MCELLWEYELPLLPLIHSSPLPLLLLLFRLPGLHHVTRKSGSLPLPLLTERKYCNRRGRRWALLRRRLKITGIFKAAEESQGRQRLDSLPPGRSSLSSLSASFSHDFSSLALPPCEFKFTFSTNPCLGHIFRRSRKPTAKVYEVMNAWLHPRPLPQLCLAIKEAWLELSKQTAPAKTSTICTTSHSQTGNLLLARYSSLENQ